MGIAGLLPIVASKLVRKHISAYGQQRIGIDGHAWLYQILPSVAEDLFFKVPTKKHVAMFETKIRALMQHGVVPVVVLDGDGLASKEGTNERRRVRKEKSRREAEHWLAQNNPEKAKVYMRQCISVSREAVYDLTRMLEAAGVEYIVSPYESDAQLCYLQRMGYIDCILTEDSDLIAYGSDRILYKFDSSFVYEFNRECLEHAKDRVFMDSILDISILSGCDYLESIQGVGVTTAHKLLSRERTVENVVAHLQCRKQVPPNYLEDFFRARKTFLHQIVYDPIQRKRRHLQDTEEQLDFLGTLENKEYEFDRQEHLFKSSTRKEVKRHFVPETKKRRSEELAPRKREKIVEVDMRLHSPYFNK